MTDLSLALQGSEKKYMLGGGNPAHIPELERVFRKRMEEIPRAPGSLETMLGYYDSASANASFAAALLTLLMNRFGWPIGPESIAVTNGSQTAFFLLFNLFGGRTGGDKEGKVRKVVFPLCPEYVGYAD